MKCCCTHPGTPQPPSRKITIRRVRSGITRCERPTDTATPLARNVGVSSPSQVRWRRIASGNRHPLASTASPSVLRWMLIRYRSRRPGSSIVSSERWHTSTNASTQVTLVCPARNSASRASTIAFWMINPASASQLMLMRNRSSSPKLNQHRSTGSDSTLPPLLLSLSSSPASAAAAESGSGSGVSRLSAEASGLGIAGKPYLPSVRRSLCDSHMRPEIGYLGVGPPRRPFRDRGHLIDS